VAAVPSIGRATGVEGAAAPEADATRALYERYGNQIFGYCLHQLGSREEAEDAVQSTFLNAFRGLRRGVVPEAEQAWLFKIAQNVCLSRRRSTWRRGRIESPADFEVAEETTAAPSRRADELIGLQDVLEQMPENQRRAILLREWQGLSYREIAEELELSQAAVETLIFRARRSLAQGLETSPVEQRSRRARLRPSLDLGALAGWLKSFLLSGVAVKAAGTAAVVAVTSAVVAAPARHPRSHAVPSRPAAPRPAAVVTPPLALHGAAPAPVAAAPRIASAQKPRAHARRAHHAPTRPAARTHAVAVLPASRPVQAQPTSPAPAAPAPTPAAGPSGNGHAGAADGKQTGSTHSAKTAPQPPAADAHTVTGQSATPPGHGGAPPGQTKTPPGQGGTPPGQSKTPPGQGGTPPGQSQTPPGQSKTPPGQGGTPPGQSGNGNGNQDPASTTPAAPAPADPAAPPAAPPADTHGNGGGNGNGNAGGNGNGNPHKP
jgi:RNA polymerase sigma factor (sigma-70 family)